MTCSVLVLAYTSWVPAALRGKNPIPDFRAIGSCQAIGTGNTATVDNVSTGNFKASMAGNSKIDAKVTLPRPCIAPIIFVTAPNIAWFSATHGLQEAPTLHAAVRHEEA